MVSCFQKTIGVDRGAGQGLGFVAAVGLGVGVEPEWSPTVSPEMILTAVINYFP